ncbi:MAG TPA: acyl carrier protein, partial [Pseudonocardiaceae bacterium]
ARTTADEVPSVLRDLIQPARRAVSAEPAAAPLPERLSSLSEPAATELLLAMVRDTAAAALGHSDLAAIDADGAFWDVGFSSLIAVEFRNRLGELTGVRLSAAIVYDQPTPRMLAEHLMARLRPVTADLV